MIQGVPGAYSEDAALKAYPHCETVPCDEFEDAFKVSNMMSILTFCGRKYCTPGLTYIPGPCLSIRSLYWFTVISVFI